MSFYELDDFCEIFIIFFVTGFISYCFLLSDDPPIFGIYRQKTPTYYIKFVIAYLLVKFRKRPPIRDEDAEKLQQFSTHPLAIDAVFFSTFSPDRQILSFALARRKKGLVNTMGFLRIPDFSEKLLVIPIYPSSSLYQTEVEQNITDCYTVSGIKITPIEPMKEWHLEYNGKMCFENDLSTTFDVKINAKWTAELPPFNYSTDISAYAMGKALALESWSRQYFDNVKSHHQTHFEQYGKIEGTAVIDGQDYEIRTSGLRDHSFGFKRDWNDFHRYVLHWIQLENGDGITIGVISAPVMFSRLVIGHISCAETKKNYPIAECDIELYRYGKHPPDNYAFSFWCGNKRYVVEVKAFEKAKVMMGEQNEARIVEEFCEFRVNGMKGWGGAEWEYRNMSKKN